MDSRDIRDFLLNVVQLFPQLIGPTQRLDRWSYQVDRWTPGLDSLLRVRNQFPLELVSQLGLLVTTTYQHATSHAPRHR